MHIVGLYAWTSCRSVPIFTWQLQPLSVCIRVYYRPCIISININMAVCCKPKVI